MQEPGFDPWVGNIPWRREWQPIRVFLPGESHGQRSLGSYSAWVCKESDMTEKLTLKRLTFKNFLATLCSLWDFSSPSRDRTLAPFIGSVGLTHWTTREVPKRLTFRDKNVLTFYSTSLYLSSFLKFSRKT